MLRTLCVLVCLSSGCGFGQLKPDDINDRLVHKGTERFETQVAMIAAELVREPADLWVLHMPEHGGRLRVERRRWIMREHIRQGCALIAYDVPDRFGPRGSVRIWSWCLNPQTNKVEQIGTRGVAGTVDDWNPERNAYDYMIEYRRIHARAFISLE